MNISIGSRIYNIVWGYGNVINIIGKYAVISFDSDPMCPHWTTLEKLRA